MPKRKAKTVTEYIDRASTRAQPKLRELRAILKHVAPKAREALKWGLPAFEEGRILFSYGAYQSHLTFVPTHPALEPFTKQLAPYKTRNDSIQFPYDKPLPKALILRIARFRVKQVRDADARWRYGDDS